MGVWVHGDGLPTPVVEHLQIDGRGGQGERYGFAINRNLSSGIVEIRASLAGEPVGSYLLNDRIYPQLDVLSARIGFDGNTVLELTMRYGRNRPCFINDDGRDRLRIRFVDSGSIRVTRVRIVDCEAVVESVD
jgi:hypothetical protein